MTIPPLVESFVEYAAAFEKAYAANDWSLVEPFFHAHAVYDAGLPELLGGRIEGRDAILGYFDRVLNGFDRRFESRTVQLLEGPRADRDCVWLKGRAVYTAGAAPDLVFDLEETARFADDRIVHLQDVYPPEERAKVLAYVAAHGERLGFDTGV